MSELKTSSASKEFICKDCKKPFTMTESHIKWYENKGLAIPTHCPECIAKRKEMISEGPMQEKKSV